MDLPGTAAGTVDAMSATNDAIVLEAVTVKLFPISSLRGNNVLDPTHAVCPLIWLELPFLFQSETDLICLS
jgi:hypothetical protein